MIKYSFVTRINFLLLLASSFFISCIQELDVFFGSDPVLIIDGTITTNEGPHRVKIGFSRTYNEPADFTSIESCKVIIIDEEGIQEVLSYNQNGIFVTSPQFCAKIGMKYKLSVDFANGKSYTSTLEEVMPITTLENASITRGYKEELSQKDVIINADYLNYRISFRDDPNEKNYYRWRFRSTYQVFAPLARENYHPVLNPSFAEDCWVTVFDHDYLNIESDLLFNGEYVSDYEIFNVKAGAPHEIGYYTEIEQLSLTLDHYNYLKALKDQIDNNGSIFETANYQIRGNMRNEELQEELVLGYFAVCGVSKATTFISGITEYANYDACFGPFNFDQGPPGYCADCRLYASSSTTVKPDFWPN